MASSTVLTPKTTKNESERTIGQRPRGIGSRSCENTTYMLSPDPKPRREPCVDMYHLAGSTSTKAKSQSKKGE